MGWATYREGSLAFPEDLSAESRVVPFVSGPAFGLYCSLGPGPISEAPACNPQGKRLHAYTFGAVLVCHGHAVPIILTIPLCQGLAGMKG